MEELISVGIDIGTTTTQVIFSRFSIENTGSYLGKAVGKTCLDIGGRPGLRTAESMSAYIVYRGTVDMEESRRTVVSNIHRNGFPPVEAGAYIAELMLQMLERKVSGVEFKR